MRSRRNNRRALALEIDRLKAENESLAKALAEGVGSITAPVTGKKLAEECPPIICGGYSARANAVRPKTLKQAKEILLSLNEW